MKKTFRRILFEAWFSPALYREIGRRWTGLGGPYVLFVVFLIWLPFIVLMIYLMIRLQMMPSERIAPNMPILHIKDGQMRMNKSSPHFMLPINTQRGLIVFDLNAKPADLLSYQSFLLLTKKQIVFPYHQTVRTIDLSQIGDWTLSQSKVAAWIKGWTYAVITTLAPLIIVLGFIYRMGVASLLGIYAWLLSRLIRTKLEFSTCIRLSAIAMTPGMLLSMLEYAIPGYLYPNLHLLALLNIAYVSFAVISNRHPD